MPNITGTLAATDQLDGFASAGTLAVAGSSAITESNDTLSAAWIIGLLRYV